MGRWIIVGVLVGWLGIGGVGPAFASDDDTKQVVNGVLSGLLGVPQQDAYSAKERDQLVSLLQGGQYVTSRQGEPVDLMMYGVPLTRAEHVYTARPVPPASSTSTP